MSSFVIADRPPLVVVSNRGPLNFKRHPDGTQEPTRAGGGLVASIGPAIEGTASVWVAAGVGDEPIEPCELDNLSVHTVTIDRESYRQYYDVIANGTLWFLHHNLFDLARQPRIDETWWDAWHRYCDVNEAFGRKVAETAPEGAIVLVHDYHLTMLGTSLKQLRPDLKTVHFHHTPFAGRNTVAVLPQTVLQRLLQGLLDYDACGFHSQRWADNFALACADGLGRIPNTFVAAAAADPHELARVAQLPETHAAKKQLQAIRNDRKLIVRVDRIELSKNLLRGFYAYDDMLRRYPQWRNNVVFVAYIYPSRETIADYVQYRNEVEALVERINAEWSTPDWTPITLSIEDNFPRSVAALMQYDVLLVNPIRDGLNLVAKEGALLNEKNGAIVLSRETGSWIELSEGAIGVNPFDISGTSDALVHALEMHDGERSERAQLMRRVTLARTPLDWLNDQINAVRSWTN